MGKGDKKSRRGKIIMGSFGVSRPRKKAQSYKFVPRGKKESIATLAEQPVVALSPEAATLAQTVKPKKKAAPKTAKVSKKKEA